jgi:hypothetical protein
MSPFGAEIKLLVGAAEDQNLSESFIRKANKCHHLHVALGILASHFVMAIPVSRCQMVELTPHVILMRKEHF